MGVRCKSGAVLGRVSGDSGAVPSLLSQPNHSRTLTTEPHGYHSPITTDVGALRTQPGRQGPRDRTPTLSGQTRRDVHADDRAGSPYPRLPYVHLGGAPGATHQ